MDNPRSYVWKHLYAKAWGASVDRGTSWKQSRCIHLARRGRCWLSHSRLHAAVWGEAVRRSGPRNPAGPLYRLWIACPIQWIYDRADGHLARDSGASIPGRRGLDLGALLSLLRQRNDWAYEVYARWTTRTPEEIAAELKLTSPEEARNLYKAAILFLESRLTASSPTEDVQVQTRDNAHLASAPKKPVPPSVRELERVHETFRRRIREQIGLGMAARDVATAAGLEVDDPADLDAVLGALASLFTCRRSRSGSKGD